MTDINTFFFIGNLGNDPELAYTATGTARCKFPIALSRFKQDASGNRTEKTSWVDITAWGKQAENVAKYLAKGSKVGVKGYVEQSSWIGKDGNKKYGINFVSESIQFLSKPKEKSQNTYQKNGQTPYQSSSNKTQTKSFDGNQNKNETGEDLEDIPF